MTPEPPPDPDNAGPAYSDRPEPMPHWNNYGVQVPVPYEPEPTDPMKRGTQITTLTWFTLGVLVFTFLMVIVLAVTLVNTQDELEKAKALTVEQRATLAYNQNALAFMTNSRDEAVAAAEQALPCLDGSPMTPLLKIQCIGAVEGIQDLDKAAYDGS